MSARRRDDEDRLLAAVLGEEGEGAPWTPRDAREAERAGEYAALTALLRTQDPHDAVRWDTLRAPFGTLWLAATGAGLARVSWEQEDEEGFEAELRERWPDRPVVRDAGALEAARTQLREYFDGERDHFDLRVDLSDLKPFQRDVLEAVRGVAFGDVVPYAELARRIRRPRAQRAVGNALGRNPVAIVVPCHRVVRSDGTLGGYGGGVEYKKRLLTLEGREDLLRAG